MIVATLVPGMASVFAAAPPTPAMQNASQPIRVSSVAMQARLVHSSQLKYPEAARKKNIQGTVTLDVVVGADGKVKSVKVADGPKQLTKAAANAVKEWQYQPMMLNGKPIEVETTVALTFKLTKPPAKPAKGESKN
jgi:bla regulator protein blaR1